MPPRLSLFTARSLAYRSKPTIQPRSFIQGAQQRLASSDATNEAADKSINQPKEPKGPNMDQLPHVSEEQAAMDKITGDTPPDISQGTPVKEVLERDASGEAQDKAPEVIKQKMENPGSAGAGQKRSYSTSARRNATEVQSSQTSDLVHFNQTMAHGLEYPDAGLGHKFPLPDVSAIPRSDHLKRRYDPILDQVTKAMMKHGKLSVAQKNMSIVLDTLRTSSPPAANPTFPNRNLLTSVPRPSLPLSPIEYLTTTIDSVAPLVKIRQQRGIAGGGASLPIPVPLGKRQRRRTAIQWIMDSAAKRKETRLADRVAKEIVSIAEGKSGVWERRALVHKLGISARSNVRMSLLGQRGRK